MSLRYQINIRIVLTSIVILILGGMIAVWQARLSVKTELDSSLNLAAQLIQLNFQNQPQRNTVVVDAWLPRFVSLEQTRHLTIQLQQPTGKIISFAAKTKPINETNPPQWFVQLISAQSPKIEQQLTNAGGKPISLIIQANPNDEISEAWQESCAFFATLAIMTAITFITVNLLFSKTLKTIGIIVESLKAIEHGNYRQKLPAFPTLEFGSIANAINHTADVLDTAHKENSALSRHSLQIQEDERQQLAKELHDELGQSLTAIKVMATTTKTEKSDTGQIADTIISVCDHLITVVRLMMRNLHPLVLTELGLKASLEDLLNHWLQRHPELSITLTCPDVIDKIQQKIAIQVFRIVQECLTNIVRHAKATEAAIHLEINLGQTLHLEIIDNGQGCLLSETKKGFGLLAIRERVNSLDGELTIQAESQQGMKITVNIPLKYPFPSAD